ncbi:hypothetical protein ACNQ2T_00920 [Mycoplasma sp. Z407A]|uniref:hypothetical protein n=1 Tax=Mycoplasma sp. Z407A TaxID=3401678 RepID=UPI003AACC3A8
MKTNFNSEIFNKYIDALENRNDTDADVFKVLDEYFYAYEYCAKDTSEYLRYVPSEKEMLCKIIGLPPIIATEENINEFINQVDLTKLQAANETINFIAKKFEPYYCGQISRYFEKYSKSERCNQFNKARKLISGTMHKDFEKIMQERCIELKEGKTQKR